jgi:hypothetical protein
VKYLHYRRIEKEEENNNMSSSPNERPRAMSPNVPSDSYRGWDYLQWNHTNDLASNAKLGSTFDRPHTSLALTKPPANAISPGSPGSGFKNTQFDDTLYAWKPSRQIDVWAGVRPHDSAQNKSIDFTDCVNQHAFNRRRAISPPNSVLKLSAAGSPGRRPHTSLALNRSLSPSSFSPSASASAMSPAPTMSPASRASPAASPTPALAYHNHSPSFKGSSLSPTSPTSGTSASAPFSMFVEQQAMNLAEKEFVSLSTVYQSKTIQSNVKAWGRDSVSQRLPRSLSPTATTTSRLSPKSSQNPSEKLIRSLSPEQEMERMEYVKSEIDRFEERLRLT